MELKLVAILVLVLVCVAEARSLKKKTAHARSFGGIALRSQVRSFDDDAVGIWLHYIFFGVDMRPSWELDQCFNLATNDESSDATVNMYKGEECVCSLDHEPCGPVFAPVPENEQIESFTAVPKTDVQSCITLATLTLEQGSLVNEGGFVKCVCDFGLYPCYGDEDGPGKKEWVVRKLKSKKTSNSQKN